MELLEIRSEHDLTAPVPEERPAKTTKYTISCRQFMAVLRDSNKHRNRGASDAARPPALGFMTLDANQIWITQEEIERVVAAIEASRSPVSLP